MRLISFSATVLSSLLSSAVLAQQPSDSIGHPPQIQGPPPISEPSATKQPTPAASAPEASEPASKGYMGHTGPPVRQPHTSQVQCRRWMQDQSERSLGLTALRK